MFELGSFQCSSETLAIFVCFIGSDFNALVRMVVLLSVGLGIYGAVDKFDSGKFQFLSMSDEEDFNVIMRTMMVLICLVDFGFDVLDCGEFRCFNEKDGGFDMFDHLRFHQISWNDARFDVLTGKNFKVLVTVMVVFEVLDCGRF